MSTTSSDFHDTFPAPEALSDHTFDLDKAAASDDNGILPYMTMTDSQRRQHFGLSVSKLGIYADSCPSSFVPSLCPDQVYSRDQVWALLQRAKSFMGVRSIDPDSSVLGLDRRTGDRSKAPQTVADLFPAVMHSYSSRLKRASDDTFTVSKTDIPGAKPFFSNVARSRNRWLDPVAQVRLALQDRVRIQRAIAFAYDNGLVPVLATFTIPHHWDSLDQLRQVLRKARTDVFRGRAGEWLANAIGLRYYINDFEITITEKGGFHPHCHSLLLLDRALARRLDEPTFSIKPGIAAQIELRQLQEADDLGCANSADHGRSDELLSKACTRRNREARANFSDSHCQLDSPSAADRHAIDNLCQSRSKSRSNYDDPDLFTDEVKFRAEFMRKLNDPRSQLFTSPEEQQAVVDAHIYPFEYLIRRRWFKLIVDTFNNLFPDKKLRGYHPKSYKSAIFFHGFVISREKVPDDPQLSIDFNPPDIDDFDDIDPDEYEFLKASDLNYNNRRNGKVTHCKDGNYLAEILSVADNEKLYGAQSELLSSSEFVPSSDGSSGGDGASSSCCQTIGASSSDGTDRVRYGIDAEISADTFKKSTIPFDLLREVSAHNIDMWNEYALSTKGWHKIQFAKGLQQAIDSYFHEHPDNDPANKKPDFSCEPVLQLDDQSYYYFLNSNLIPELLERSKHGFDAVYKWAKDEHGITILPPKPKPPPPSSAPPDT